MDRGSYRYRPSMRIRLPIIAVMLLACASPAAADDEVPFWASIRASVINMRVGPGEEYKINWVYRRPGLPLKVLRVKDSWWLVQDPDGAQGWMLLRFLTRKRSAYVQGKGFAEMQDRAGPSGRLVWELDPGVSGKLGDCDDGWCELTVDNRRGYVRQDRLWGAGAP